MTDTIHIQIAREEFALMRLLGLVQRRGFAVHSLHADPCERTGGITVRMRIAGARSIDTLLRHVENLTGVIAAHHEPHAQIPATLQHAVA